MELSQARALVAVGEFSSFVSAGRSLHLSPPAVFAQIRQLEAEMGEKLYERSGRRLLLTPAGRVLVEYCLRLITLHDEAVGMVREFAGLQTKCVQLGCGPHISASLVPHLLRAYLGAFPKVEIRLATGSDAVLFEQLQSGKVDLILMNLPTDTPGYVQDSLWRYELVFVLPPNDPAAKQVIVSAETLATRRFILYQRSVVIDAAIRDFCVRVGFNPNVVMHNDQADSIKELVKLGMGISLLPLWSVSEDVRQGSLAVVRMNSRQLFSVTGLIYRDSNRRSAALQGLINTAHDWQKWLPWAGDVSPIRR